MGWYLYSFEHMYGNTHTQSLTHMHVYMDMVYYHCEVGDQYDFIPIETNFSNILIKIQNTL